ncbi:glycosyltransferase family 8 protein [Xylariaceae sp. FL1272]|nr:glycosyltransferase family 8 protein [Xylariaceae sp. FL1272]
MAVPGGGEEDVYATLLLSDTYLPGALVLAHSLRDAATTKKLAVLVTLDSVSAEAINELRTLYDYIIPVPRIRNSHPANLELMNRADLHSAFTKINLWKQTQFRKIVYIDADVVAFRAPDELFSITHPFSAAPDIGWPDLFNTGVMVLTPNMGDYYAMVAMAERGISFDGADQGLINMHFRSNYNRISFTYNVTPSAHYQYIPAYRHFQSSINMAHFIGSDKPWFKGRYSSIGNSPFDEMTGRWWAVYDRHYRVSEPLLRPSTSSKSSVTNNTTIQSNLELVQYLTKGEFQPTSAKFGANSKPQSEERYGHGHHFYHEPVHSQGPESHEGPETHRGPEFHPSAHHHDIPYTQVHDHHRHHHEQNDAHGHEPPFFGTIMLPPPEPSSFVSSDVISSLNKVEGTPAEAREEQVHTREAPAPQPEVEHKPPPFQPSMSNWDAQRHAPPSDSKPEAANFPATVYEMSQSAAPFVAPKRYPSPPRNMWYEVPKDAPTGPSEPPRAIFPWEANQPKPTRVFVDEEPQISHDRERRESDAFSGEQSHGSESQASTELSVVDSTEPKSEPVTPITPTIQITPSDPWTSFTRNNAWDDVPEIERYVDSMQKHTRSKSLKSKAPGMIALPSPGDGVDGFSWQRRGSKLTDFPSEVERPSLPVTPAPIRRPNFWSGGSRLKGDDDVPSQDEWVCVHGQRWRPSDCLCDLTNVLRVYKDPVAQLQKLAKQQSEAILQKLGGSSRDSDDLPSRPMPFGSEGMVSPTYVARSAQVLSPRPVKGHASAVLNLVTDLDATPRGSPQRATTQVAPAESTATDRQSSPANGK